MFFDAHIHNIGDESGGFLIGLEGEPRFEGTLTNRQVIDMHSPQDQHISFYYVSKSEIQDCCDWRYLKFHPRREKYSINEIGQSISLNRPKCVIIDTLNAPYLNSYDYWYLAKSFPEIPFIFAHAGGYAINDFIKICAFQPNVWLDFSMTAKELGHLSAPSGLPYIHQAIAYSLHGPYSDKILFGSDYPFYSQLDLVEYYDQLSVSNLLSSNFNKFINMIS